MNDRKNNRSANEVNDEEEIEEFDPDTFGEEEEEIEEFDPDTFGEEEEDETPFWKPADLDLHLVKANAKLFLSEQLSDVSFKYEVTTDDDGDLVFRASNFLVAFPVADDEVVVKLNFSVWENGLAEYSATVHGTLELNEEVLSCLNDLNNYRVIQTYVSPEDNLTFVRSADVLDEEQVGASIGRFLLVFNIITETEEFADLLQRIQ